RGLWRPLLSRHGRRGARRGRGRRRGVAILHRPASAGGRQSARSSVPGRRLCACQPHADLAPDGPDRETLPSRRGAVVDGRCYRFVAIADGNTAFVRPLTMASFLQPFWRNPWEGREAGGGEMRIGKHIRRSSIVMALVGLGIGVTWAVGGGCSPNNTTANSGQAQGQMPCPSASSKDGGTVASTPPPAGSAALLAQGEQTFRFDTFGDEAFWGDTIKLHQAIEGSANGGVGPGVSPTAALGLGLKVDVDALPASVVDGLKNGTVDLNDPATTLALLRLNAVVGLTGIFDGTTATPSQASGPMKSMGIQCALCHSTVDDSFAPGIGHRLDGWPNRDLNVGAIIASAPDLSAVATLLGVDQTTVRTVTNSWGAGKFDAE